MNFDALEQLIAEFDVRAREAQALLEHQRSCIQRFEVRVETEWMPLLQTIAKRLERSGHEVEISRASEPGLGNTPEEALHHLQLRIQPRALPGRRARRTPDMMPLLRFQLNAAESKVQVWARDVSLCGRDRLVGYRNDPSGMPVAAEVGEVDEAFMWRHVLFTLDFALRESAQEALF